MKGGLQKFEIKNSKFLIEKYLDTIKYSPTLQNLKTKMASFLSPKFLFEVHKKNSKQIENSKKNFYDYLFSKQKIFENAEVTYQEINPNIFHISFRSPKKTINQIIYINDKTKIYKMQERTILNSKGGVGFSYNVLSPPIAGQVPIKGYLDCCRPVFPGSLTGGNGGNGYYLGISEPHFNVLPQYKSYYKGLEPIYSNMNSNDKKLFCYSVPQKNYIQK